MTGFPPSSSARDGSLPGLLNTDTSCPTDVSSGVDYRPITPVPPVTSTRIFGPPSVAVTRRDTSRTSDLALVFRRAYPGHRSGSFTTHLRRCKKGSVGLRHRALELRSSRDGPRSGCATHDHASSLGGGDRRRGPDVRKDKR
jgi:hypothetical protein